jgi:RNA polymerase sigma factor (sigma-70 family)
VSAVAAATTPRSDVASHEAYAELLYERHQRAIFGFCLKQLRRREDADDAVQLTFIYALLSLRRGIVPQLELPWLLTIARNVCSTRRRSGMRRGAYESPQDLDLFQDKLASPDRSEVATTEDFTAALRAIPESQRRALLLREWRGLSYEEIGTELGLSRPATEALLFRARQNVARRLDAGLKTLQGLPFVSFLRDLFQTGVAKLVAVGAGAALTVVAVPAGQPNSQPAQRPAAVRPHAAPSPTRPQVVPPARPATRAPARRDVGARAPAGRSAQTRRAVHISPPRAAEAPPATQSSPPPSNDASGPQPAPQQDAGVAAPLQPSSDDVGTAVELPPVSLPPMPPLPLPLPLPTITVQTPTVPSVSAQLP